MTVSASSDIYQPLDEALLASGWPISQFIPDFLDQVYVGSATYNDTTDVLTEPLIIAQPLQFRIPGVDEIALVVGSSAPSTSGGDPAISNLSIDFTNVGFAITLPLQATIDSSILTPVLDGTSEPDPSKPNVVLDLGPTGVGINADGDISLSFGNSSPGTSTASPPSSVDLPRCLVGSTGVVVQAKNLGWVSPSSAQPAPHGAPLNFSGFYLAGGSIEIVSLGLTLGLEYLFIGTGGVTCNISAAQTIKWDDSNQTFSGSNSSQIPTPLMLFGDSGGGGFQAALTAVDLTITQNTFTALTITGDLYIPFLDAVVGVTLGVDARGGITALATTSNCTPPPANGAKAPTSGQHLCELQLFDILTIDVDAIGFALAPGQPAVLDIAGQVQINNLPLSQDGKPPTVGLKGLRIDSNGNVAIDGGWLDLDSIVPAALSGVFPVTISKLGFGNDAGAGRWVGLNGGFKMADGLPVGATVSGLRIYFDSKGLKSVSLEGIGIAVQVPAAFSFAGSAKYFHNSDTDYGFNGNLKLTIDDLGVEVDASLVVGDQNGTLYFFLSLQMDLPAGIPLFITGLGIYGFAGLIAINMAPNRQPDQDWYSGWYKGSPIGVTDGSKWMPQDGAVALGLGTTIGTEADDGFSCSAKALLVIVLPGPDLIIQGKASFLSIRPGALSPDEGTLDALFVLDVPDCLFQADIAATYQIPLLLNIGGGAEVAASWAPTPPTVPKDLWHFYLGTKTTPLKATILGVFNADAYLMLSKNNGLIIGGDFGVSAKVDFGIAKAWYAWTMSGFATLNTNPDQFDASLTLSGSAGLNAFGVGMSIALSANVEAQGPKPWKIVVDLKLEIKIDLFFTHLDFKCDLSLTWQQAASQSLVTPIVSAIASDNLVAKDPIALLPLPTNPPPAVVPPYVPPDGRPVITFSRPVVDLGSIGAAAAQPPPDKVDSHTWFVYALANVVLRTANNTLVAAAGSASLSGSSLTPVGPPPPAAPAPALPDTEGCLISISGQPPVGAAVEKGVITLVGAPAAQGSAPVSYSLTGPQATDTVQIATVNDQHDGTADLTLGATPAAGVDVYAGGALVDSSSNSWAIAGATDATTLTIQAPSTTDANTKLPLAGAATVTAPSPPKLQGMWLPNAGTQAQLDQAIAQGVSPAGLLTPMTKLMLWADCPFAYFRNNTSQTSDLAPTAYPCGLPPVERPYCMNFNSLTLGWVSSPFQIDGMTGTAGTPTRVDAIDSLGNCVMRIGVQVLPGGSEVLAGSAVTFTFSEPVNVVQLSYSVDREFSASGRVSYTFQTSGGSAQSAPLKLVQGSGQNVSLGGVGIAITAVTINGRGVTLSQICVTPGWTCVEFDPNTFPQTSTGTQTYQGMQFISDGVMSVITLPDGTTEALSVSPAPVSAFGRYAPAPIVSAADPAAAERYAPSGLPLIDSSRTPEIAVHRNQEPHPDGCAGPREGHRGPGRFRIKAGVDVAGDAGRSTYLGRAAQRRLPATGHARPRKAWRGRGRQCLRRHDWHRSWMDQWQPAERRHL